MALQFNSYLLGPSGILAAMNANYISGNNLTIRVFPDTVSFPAARVDTHAGLPGGHILSYASLSTGISGNFIVITAGTTTAAASAAGTLSWFALMGNNTNYLLISDSVNTGGNGALLSVSTLTPSNGLSVSITYSFRFI